MKHLLGMILVLMIASPALAARGGGGGSSINSLFTLSAVGGISHAYQEVLYVGPPYQTTAKNYASYGLLANWKFPVGSLGLTTGILYAEFGSHQYEDVGGGQVDEFDEKLPYLVIPLTLDFWIGHYVIIGAGGYYALANGNMSDTGTDTVTGVVTPINVNRSFADNNYDSKDMGLLAHVQFFVPIKGHFALTAVGYYAVGLTNLNKAPISDQLTTRNKTVLALGGFSYRF